MTLYVTPSGYSLSSENIDETGAIGNHGQRTVVVGGCISHEFRTKIRALNELAGAEQTHDYGYARVSTHGQSGDAQVRQLRSAGAGKVFREVASGAKTDRRSFAACWLSSPPAGVSSAPPWPSLCLIRLLRR